MNTRQVAWRVVFFTYAFNLCVCRGRRRWYLDRGTNRRLEIEDLYIVKSVLLKKNYYC